MVGCDRLIFNSTASEYMTPEMGLLIGQALAKEHHTVVVGMDYIRSSPMMKNALVSGLLSSGIDVIDIGCVPAPVITRAAHLGDCAVYVTGGDDYELVSGFMIVDNNGNLFDDEELRKLDWVIRLCPQPSKPMAVGRLIRKEGFVESYKHDIIADFNHEIGCSVILDCSYGCCSLCAPQILDELGADIVTINAQRDGNRDVGCGTAKESGLRTIKRFIGSVPGTIGIFMNRTGTKVRLVDEQHENVPFGIMETIITRFLKPHKVVVPFDETRLVEDALFDRGMSVSDFRMQLESPFPEQDDTEIIYCSPVLEKVCETMKENSAELGFYRGNVIFSDGPLFPDGIKTSVILCHMASLNSVHNVIDDILMYERECTQADFECSRKEFEKCFGEYAKRTYSSTRKFDEGWRIEMDKGWASVSFSPGSSNLLNIIAESKDHAYLVGMMEMIKSDIRACSSGISVQ